jgi:chromosome segregation protein
MGDVRLVTKAGELIDPSGAMTGGTLNMSTALKFGAAAESKLDAVGAELRSVTAALETLRQTLRDVRAEIRAFDDEMRNAAAGSADVQGKIAGYEAQLNVLREKRKKASDDLNAEKGKLAEVLKELDAAQKELKKVIDSLNALKDERTALREDMVRIAPEGMQEHMQTTQDNAMSAQAELSELSVESAELEAERDSIEKRKNVLLREIKAAEDKIASRLTEKAAEEETIKRLTIDIEGLRKIEEDYESKISGLRDARDKVLEQKVSTESERDNVSDKITTKVGVAAGFEAKI